MPLLSIFAVFCRAALLQTPSSRIEAFSKPLSSKPFGGYSQRTSLSRNALRLLPAVVTSRKTLSPSVFRAQSATTCCTKCCHPPVDALHSTENEPDTGTHFSLTSKLEGVQQDRSLTVS